MASSSSSASDSQYCPRWKYDVFLSFRGEDTRKTFTGHLYEGLKNRGIFTFQDDKRLEHGDSISEELLKAIEESQVAIIVFSKNYGTSRWCLNELVKIMECKVENGQIVIPVFYDVDPSHVRNQSESFAIAFAEHELKYKDDVEGMRKVQGWRTALTTAADLKGYDIRNEIESEKIQQIVDYISSKFCKSARSLYFLQDVVGINAHLEKLKSLLQIEINDVRVLGIWGIGGIGKTTIAKALFDTLSYQFKGACFLADVKENARKNQLHSLQNTLLSEVLRSKDDYVNNKHDGKSIIPSRLCSMKVLIVLDDIDHGDHLEYLAGDVGWFGNGSRVIVTTRDRHLIEKDDALYEVPTLPDHEAMQLFNQHAFKKEVPDERFKELSLEVVDHAKGLPLALKVWGSLLHKKGLPQWRRTVDQIKKSSNSEIVEKLKISYDGLEPEEQEIFLDIACFFRGKLRTEVMQILESCDFGAEYGLDVLIDKSLVFISEYDKIEMHDLIEDMGKYIVKMQKDSRKPSRIWDVEDFEDVMVDNMRTMAVEAIWIPHHINLCFSEEAMKNMRRLRILCIQGLFSRSGSIECRSNNLRWFIWLGYPWKSLPQNFNPTRLVHLNLAGSSLHHLWNETKQLTSLRWLYLRGSESLKRTPDFTGMPNLEYLDLSECTSLEEVHDSLRCSRKLIELDLNGCVSLERFPYVNVESLKSLNIYWCSSLEKLPEFLGIMKPQAHLTELYLYGMHNLVSLPSSICKLKDLVKLIVFECSKLKSLPEEIGDLKKLEVLEVKDSLISRPPSSIVWLNKLKLLTFAKEISEDRANFVFPRVNEGLRSLEGLDLRDCNLIDGGLPEDIGSLSSLKFLNLSCCNLIDGGLPEGIGSLHSLKELNLSGNNFEQLPQSIAQLGALQTLYLSDCKRLKRFPYVNVESLKSLGLDCCSSLEKLPEILGIMKPELVITMSFSGIRELPSSIFHPQAHLTRLYLRGMPNLVSLPSSICKLKDLVKLNVSECSKLESLPEEIGDLEKLEVLDAWDTLISRPPSSIVRLNKLKLLIFAKEKSEDRANFVFPQVNEGLRSLEELNLSYCNLIDGGIPEDIGSLFSLKELNLSGNNFEHLPRSIAQLGALRTLNLSNCKRLKELPEIPQQLNTIHADWSSDSICNSLFQNISSLQHDVSASDSLSLRVFKSWPWHTNIPSWFHHQGTGASVSVNLPENWYVSDNFLGFAVCYSGKLFDIAAHLDPLCDDGMSSMTQKFALSIHSGNDIHFLLVPLAGLWDASKANGKTPNDYGCFRINSPRVLNRRLYFGVRLLYKHE